MKRSIILAVILGVLLSAIVIARHYASAQLERAKPYKTYRTLIYLAQGCDAFQKERGRWPQSMEELKAYRKDLEEWSKDAYGNNIKMVPFDLSKSYGVLNGEGKNKALLEIRFPLESNSNWNQSIGKDSPRPRLRP